MDTLLAGSRKQQDGPVSEALVVQERSTGQVDIEFAIFDEDVATNKTGPELYAALVSRSFITIPSSMMDKIMRAWQERHPEEIADPAWHGTTEGTAQGELAAAGYVGERTGSQS